MKKRVMCMLLVVVMALGMFPGTAFAASSVEEALGEVDIYDGGVSLSYLSINGRVRELIYTYYNYVNRNGQTKEIPAYCVNPNTKGVPQTVAEGESIKYLAEQLGSDPKVMGIIANGYPHRGLSELKLENKYQAYYATKMALWAYLLPNWDINNMKVNPNLTGVELERANKILAATKDIYRRGTAWSTNLSPNVTVEADQDVAYPATVNGQEYLQQIFTVHSETWVCDYTVNVAFSDPSAVPSGTKIVDMNNREIDVITTQATGNGYAGQFKILYPVGSVEGQSGSVQLSFRTNVYQYAIYYAVCAEVDKYGKLQNYMVDTDPTTPLSLTAYSNYTDSPEEEITETSLKIIKYEEGTTIPLKGAQFEVVDPEGATVGTFSTNSKGQIIIPLTLAGNYTVYEREAPNGYLLSEEPAQNVKVEYGEQATVTFENAPYGTLMVRKYSDSGMQLPGAVIKVEHIESGATYTGETNYSGVAIFDEIKPGAYRIQEIAAPAGYIMTDEIFTATVISGDTVEVPIVNEEKPGLRIIKYDSKTHEALPNISFEIFHDTQSLGIFKTDEFGEILLVDLEPGTYVAKEVATDSSHIINSNPQQIELEGSDGILELIFFNDQKPGIHLVKLDSTNLEPLPNARFRIEHVGGTFSKEYVTDENGEIDLTNLEPGAYKVTELEAPDGYLIDDATRVIQINGNENAQFVFTNTRMPSFRLVKLDSYTSEGLAGATFRIARIADGTHYLDRVTDTNGEINISDLEPGVYSIIEMDAPEGYVKDTREYHVELFPGQTSELVVSNDRMPNLEILKTDAITGRPVAGVTFTVKRVDSSTLTTVTSDESGRCFLEKLMPGVYEIWEQSVPDGYLLNEEHQLITLFPNRTGTVQFQNYPKPTLTVNKIDSVTGDPIQGAKFSVTFKSDNTSTGEIRDLGTYYSDENGQFFIDKLDDGWYTITELEPAAGYSIKDPATVETYVEAGRGKTVTFENTPLSAIVVKKVDANTGDPLQGAWFRVRYLGGTSGTGGTIIAERQTSSNGTFVLTGLKAGTYVVEEISAPNGYVLSEDDIQTVYLSGKDQDVITVTFGNEAKGSVLIKKIDAITREPISDVTFLVTESDGSVVGNSNGQYTTDSAGTILIEGIDPDTTLVIKETRAREGYVLDETPQTVKVKSGETVTCEFRNYPEGTIHIIKKDAFTKEPIAGVEFLVTTSNGTAVGSNNGRYTTDSSGSIVIPNLDPETTLIIKETKAKAGYILDDTPQQAVIKSNAVAVVEFLNQPLGSLQILKKDAFTRQPLAGVQFMVTKADGSVIGNGTGIFTTDADGSIVINGLEPEMTVIIKEVRAKDGYILDDTPKQATIKTNEVTTVEFLNQPLGSLQILKKDSNTREPLEGVQFMVTQTNGAVIGNGTGIFTTDADGSIVINGLEPEMTVIIKEVRAKDGYLLDDTPKQATIKSNEVTTVEFLNQPLGGLRIVKLDSVTKKPLEGVQFRVTYSDGSYVPDEGGKLSSNGIYRTDKNGEILISDIVGTLVVTEIETIPGYVIDEETRSQTVVVNTNDLQTLTFYNRPAGGLQIIKSDEDTGARIGGVKFEIRKINGEILGTYTTDRNGVISIPGAESGWYTITELKAATGYELDATPIQACVKDGETTTVEVTNQRMASIMIHKVDANTGRGIYGVKFVLYDSGKNPIGEYTTDQNGYIYIDDELTPGKYYIRELEAADGYILDEQYKTVYVERGRCAQIEWENSAVTGEIQIRKYAADDNYLTGQRAGEALEGAVFEITQARSGAVVGYIVTDARGVAASGPLPLGRYFVTEVSAPKYYQLSGERMEAEIEYPNQIIKLSAYNKAANLGVTIKKTGNYEVQPGQVMSYAFSGIGNTSNVALNSFFWHDRIPTDATRAISLSTGTYNQRMYYKVTFKTNLNDYRTLASNLLTTNNYSLSLNATTLGLAQGEYVTDVRFEFGTVPSGFASVVNPTMRVQVQGTVSNGYQIINRADVGGQYLNEWQTAKATWVTTVRRFQNTSLPKTGY